MIVRIPPIVVFNTGYLYNLFQYHLDELNDLCNDYEIDHIHQYRNYNPTECLAFRTSNPATLGFYISILDQLGDIGYCMYCYGSNIATVKLEDDHIYFDIDTEEVYHVNLIIYKYNSSASYVDMYILQPKNYKEEVYDLIISYNMVENCNIMKIISNSMTIHHIRFLLDSNEHMTYISNNVLYLQSGLVDIQLILQYIHTY